MNVESSRRGFLKGAVVGGGAVVAGNIFGRWVRKAKPEITERPEADYVELTELLKRSTKGDVSTIGWIRGVPEGILRSKYTHNEGVFYGLRMYPTQECEGDSVYVDHPYNYTGHLPSERDPTPQRYFIQGHFLPNENSPLTGRTLSVLNVQRLGPSQSE